MDNLIQAVSLLTTIPVKPLSLRANLSKAAPWFTFVGLFLGIILLCADYLFVSLFPVYLAGSLVVILWLLLTGCLHLDGLADCCDALFIPSSIEKRLEVLRDPRLGAFGVTGLIISLLLKIESVIFISSGLPRIAFHGFKDINEILHLPVFALIMAPILARWMLLFIARQPMARKEGMGYNFSKELSTSVVFINAIIPILMVCLVFQRTILAISLSFLVSGCIIYIAKKRFGGITGDVLGLTVEIVEIVTLLTYSMNIPIG